MAEPFYLYTRRQGGNYYVQFRLEDGSLSNHKSTGTPNYNEARKIAMQWYSSGQIPERINSKSEKHKMTELEKVQLIKQLKIYDFEYEDIQAIVDILVSRNYLVSGILKAAPESRPRLSENLAKFKKNAPFGGYFDYHPLIADGKLFHNSHHFSNSRNIYRAPHIIR